MSSNITEGVTPTTARLATLDELTITILPNFIAPVPPKDTLRVWFEKLPKFKANPTAKRGGGQIYYSVAAIEKFFRSRMTGGAR